MEVEREKTKQKEIDLQLEKEKTKQKQTELETAKFMWVQDLAEVPEGKQNDVKKLLQKFKESVMNKITSEQ